MKQSNMLPLPICKFVVNELGDSGIISFGRDREGYGNVIIVVKNGSAHASAVDGTVVSDIEEVYEARIGCKSCPLRKQCMLSAAKKHGCKWLSIDIEVERYRRKNESLITSDEDRDKDKQEHTGRRLLLPSQGCVRLPQVPHPWDQ